MGATRVMDPPDGFSAPAVLSMLSDDAAVREVFLSEATLESMGAGCIHVNLATISPALAREAADAHAAHEVGYVAALMFGGVPVARASKLNLITAGRSEDLERVTPFLEAISAGLWPVGEDPIQANVVKVAGQVLIAAVTQSLSEAASLVKRAGDDGRRALASAHGLELPSSDLLSELLGEVLTAGMGDTDRFVLAEVQQHRDPLGNA